MNIVILAGGTGSIALQHGLYNLIDQQIEGVDTKVIVNAYDNGLSTGAVRRVLNGEILGPSDVRKNQTTRLELENPKSPYLSFLADRFTSVPSDAKEYCEARIDLLRTHLGVASNVVTQQNLTLLEMAVDEYFSHTIASKIDYDDFAIANIIYAGLAAMNGNSLRAAAKVMAKIMGIKDNVLINDDRSMFLGAVTKSGKRLTDEGDIVSWNTVGDPIVDIFFTTPHGKETKPTLNVECREAIAKADMIIMSSGTQWSSLIPTYASSGFKEAIEMSKAKILMVMNRIPDKDAPDQSASDIINTLVPKYLPTNRIHLIMDSTGHKIMKELEGDACLKTATCGWYDLRSEGPAVFDLPSNAKHESRRLAHAILQTYFKDLLNAKMFVFDYDDTLVGRGNSFPRASQYNTQNLTTLKKKAVICTGNSIKAIKLKTSLWHDDESEVSPITVFADGGINEYSYDPFRTVDEEQRSFSYVKCLDEDAKFDPKGPNSVEQIISGLCAAGIPNAKIENRGDVMITIKPIDPEYRDITRKLVELLCVGSDFEVKSSGRTTIEINKKMVRKDLAIKELLKSVNSPDYLVYIGDELEHGNDAVVREMSERGSKITCYEVKNPSDTALLLMAIKGKGQF